MDVLLPEVYAGGTESLGLLTIRTVAGRTTGVTSLRAWRGCLANGGTADAYADAGAATLWTSGTGTGTGARRRRMMMEPEAGRAAG